ncbi:MAG: hypothetical protein LBC71_02440 [Oscillospiraceae bacterium]|nr:hypothetical protein [Oscillospiraceae bacterium]
MKKIVKKIGIMSATVATMATALVVSASANTTAEVLQTAFQAIVTDVTATILLVLPIGLGLVGLVIGIRFGISWFRKLIGNAK